MKKRKKEQFKERMRVKQARATRLYRFSVAYVLLGLGLVFLGAIRV